MELHENRDVNPGELQREAGSALYVAFHGSNPMRPTCRYDLTAIDVVEFECGAPLVVRDAKGDRRRLLLRIPDPMISKDHGRLLRRDRAWILDAPDSNHGALVGGSGTRSNAIEPGGAFALGHTVFVLDHHVGLDDRPMELLSTQLSASVPEFTTFDASFGAAAARLTRIAPTELPVLLLGETGTGKEVAARAVHQLSRRPGSFVALNCGAIAPNLVESELFGHRRGAFSGATSDRLGYVRASHQGTLFLDEIAELPLLAQAALLRVLQEREVVPVGDTTPLSVDLRVCAATHRDLRKEVEMGRFREDLYARVLGVAVTLPPLRARKADLGMLIVAILRRHSGAASLRFTPQAAVRLFEYDWPRNIRELEHALSVAIALADNGIVALEHLPDEVRQRAAPDAAKLQVRAAQPLGRSPLSAQQEDQKQAIERLLYEHAHNLTEVARRLGKDRTQVYRWVRRFGISRPSKVQHGG